MFIVCKNCGAEINDGAEFCPNCGNPIEDKDRTNKISQNDLEKIGASGQVDISNSTMNLRNNNEEKVELTKKPALNKKQRIMIGMLVALISALVIGINIYDAPMKEAMTYIDDMVEYQDKIDNATDRDMVVMYKQLYNISKSSLTRTEKELSDAQLEKVNTYMESNNLNDDNIGAFSDLKIDGTNLYQDGEYTYYKGVIKNEGSSTYYNVEVRATYFNTNKEVLTTDWTYAVGSEGIRPSENAQFEIMTQVDGTVKSGELEIAEWN